MIDRIIVPASAHVTVGMLTLVLTLTTAAVALWHAWRKRERTRWMNGLLIVVQLVLMVQALIGIKLLDQGAGPLQLYIHYVGGLAPLLFFSILYWLPPRDVRRQGWALSAVTVGAFVFALMAFTIGQAFVRGAV
jgi:heme A synthase